MRTTQANNAKQSSLALEEKELALPTQDGRCQRHTTKQQMEPWKKRSWRCQLKNGVANATQESLARHQVLVPTRLPNAHWRTNQAAKRPLAHQPGCQTPNGAPTSVLNAHWRTTHVANAGWALPTPKQGSLNMSTSMEDILSYRDPN